MIEGFNLILFSKSVFTKSVGNCLIEFVCENLIIYLLAISDDNLIYEKGL